MKSIFSSLTARLNAFAYWMRRWPLIHRPAHWLRGTLWKAMKQGFWVFAQEAFANSKNFGPPGRTFSLYTALRSGWPPTNGRIAVHDQGAPQVSAASLLSRTGLNQQGCQPWPIFWAEYPNARLVSETLALLSPDKKICVESAYQELCWRRDPASCFLRLPPPVKLSGNWTSLISRWIPGGNKPPIYGHWLHDALPRLAFLSEFPPDTKILVPPRLGEVHKETLQMLGLWDRCRPTPEHHLEVEKYFFSSPVSMIACYSPYVVSFLRENFLQKRDPNYSGPRKFYFQRTSKTRLIANDEQVCEFFRRRGWGIVRDMDLTFAQTVKLFSEADAVCSPVGSNMSNIIFCKPGCVVLNIVPDLWMDSFVDWIAPLVHADYHYEVFPTGGPTAAQIIIDLQLLEKLHDSAPRLKTI